MLLAIAFNPFAKANGKESQSNFGRTMLIHSRCIHATEEGKE
jgi:hypothetical protein